MSTPRDQSEDDIGGEDFEELLEHSMSRRDDFSIGTRVEGTVVHLAGGDVFVDISGKSEAVIAADEFRNPDGSLSIGTGDRIDAYVVSREGGEIRLTGSIGRGPVPPGLLELAYRESIPVWGTVTGSVRGGYSISVGAARCFCPVSQIDIRPSSDPKAHLNKSYLFRIIEYREKGKNIILSRSALLEERRRQTEESLRDTLKPGDRVAGTVTAVRDFGVFIDLGGIEALVPKSEISWSRYADTGSFNQGARVEAAVKTLDWENRRITLSIRDCLPDPWSGIDRFAAGQTITGRVVNIIKNGAFVEIEPGLDGFIHVSRMSYVKKIGRPEDAVSRGDTVRARIISLNTADRKISLELIPDGPDPWKDPGMGLDGSVQTATIEDVKQSGLNVRLENGMRGFMPRGELSVKGESDMRARYTPGAQVKAAVLRIEQENRTLILSEREAEKMEERIDYENFVSRDAASRPTTLGSLLKNKFEDIQKKIDK